jgi:hypothetical protein
MTLAEQLAAVHRYAEYLDGLGGRAFPQRDKIAVALRAAALAALDTVQNWPEIGKTARGVLLQAPTGQQVLYSTNRISERLELVENPIEENTTPSLLQGEASGANQQRILQ